MVRFKRRPQLTKKTLSDIKRSVDRGDSADVIFQRDFAWDNDQISRKYLGSLVSGFRRDEPAERPRTFRLRGRPQKLNYDSRNYLMSMMKSQVSQVSVLALSRNFLIEYYGRLSGERIPSYRTILRAIKQARYTLKKSEMRSKLQDPVEGLDFLETIAFVHPRHMIDIDGMNNNPDSFLDKYGWAIKGQRSIRHHLDGKSYSCLAAFTEKGFVAWVIINGTTTGENVESFIRDEVSQVVDRDSFCIIDNASVNKTDDVLYSLHTVFHGRYKFSPRYQPRFKPIERAFSMVRKFIRQKEAQGVLRNGMSPTELIDKAFRTYSKWGSKSYVAQYLWNRYHISYYNVHIYTYANHAFYVNSF